MESWRKTWREGFAPLVSDEGLEALRKALLNDDPRLLQGATTSPPPLSCVADWDVEGACVIGLCGWLGDGLTTVHEVELYFARSCYAVDQAVGEPGGCRFLLNWFDETPRDEMRRQLLAEVNHTVAGRQEVST